jgi:hypothetical protein
MVEAEPMKKKPIDPEPGMDVRELRDSGRVVLEALDGDRDPPGLTVATP